MNAAEHIGRLAIEALELELNLDPKPGLVTPTGRGSHSDMDHRTFLASSASLGGYFSDCASLGAAGVDFVELQRRGLAAERDMLAATGGINTHKGAIFTLGLLCAAAGRSTSRPESGTLGASVSRHWGEAILAAATSPSPRSRGEGWGEGRVEAATGAGLPLALTLSPLPGGEGIGFTGFPYSGEPVCLSSMDVLSHGERARLLLGLPGAREHAAAGFPVLFDVTLPALRSALKRGLDARSSCVHGLLSTMAVLPDTNLAHRGGMAGLEWAQRAAEAFVAEGGVFVSGWEHRLAILGGEFEARRLSPGGSADLLAAAWFVHRFEASVGAQVRVRAEAVC
ncbi:MAG: triphosphoribosyl-dephospho-CoA synthase [Rhodocyclaceae bacterium]|nr:triphosphoribosyl-dephospho-CoA synthase [Rhodocyclaceae bacterium]